MFNTYCSTCEIGVVISCSIRRHFHVIEHSFHLLRELYTTFHFELGKHTTFRVVGNRSTSKKSFGEMAFVIAFKNVLFVYKPENDDRLVKNNINFGVRFLKFSQETNKRREQVNLTPLSPRFRWSSINNEMNSEDLSLRLIKVEKAWMTVMMCRGIPQRPGNSLRWVHFPPPDYSEKPPSK